MKLSGRGFGSGVLIATVATVAALLAAVTPAAAAEGDPPEIGLSSRIVADGEVVTTIEKGRVFDLVIDYSVSGGDLADVALTVSVPLHVRTAVITKGPEWDAECDPDGSATTVRECRFTAGELNNVGGVIAGDLTVQLWTAYGAPLANLEVVSFESSLDSNYFLASGQTAPAPRATATSTLTVLSPTGLYADWSPDDVPKSRGNPETGERGLQWNIAPLISPEGNETLYDVEALLTLPAPYWLVSDDGWTSEGYNVVGPVEMAYAYDQIPGDSEPERFDVWIPCSVLDGPDPLTEIAIEATANYPGVGGEDIVLTASASRPLLKSSCGGESSMSKSATSARPDPEAIPWVVDVSAPRQFPLLNTLVLDVIEPGQGVLYQGNERPKPGEFGDPFEVYFCDLPGVGQFDAATFLSEYRDDGCATDPDWLAGASPGMKLANGDLQPASGLAPSVTHVAWFTPSWGSPGGIDESRMRLRTWSPRSCPGGELSCTLQNTALVTNSGGSFLLEPRELSAQTELFFGGGIETKIQAPGLANGIESYDDFNGSVKMTRVNIEGDPEDPSLTVLLPPELVYRSGTSTVRDAGCGSAWAGELPDPQVLTEPGGGQRLVWSLRDPTRPLVISGNCSVTIDFRLGIADETFLVNGQYVDIRSFAEAANQPPGFNAPTDRIRLYVRLASEHRVQTQPVGVLGCDENGEARFEVTATNSGGSLDEFATLIAKVPRVGDPNTTVDTTFLAIESPAPGAIVEYSNDGGASWSGSGAGDVTHVRLRSPDSFVPGETLSFVMVLYADTDNNAGETLAMIAQLELPTVTLASDVSEAYEIDPCLVPEIQVGFDSTTACVGPNATWTTTLTIASVGTAPLDSGYATVNVPRINLEDGSSQDLELLAATAGPGGRVQFWSPGSGLYDDPDPTTLGAFIDTPLVAPGETFSVEFEFAVPDSLPVGTYRALVVYEPGDRYVSYDEYVDFTVASCGVSTETKVSHLIGRRPGYLGITLYEVTNTGGVDLEGGVFEIKLPKFGRRVTDIRNVSPTLPVELSYRHGRKVTSRPDARTRFITAVVPRLAVGETLQVLVKYIISEDAPVDTKIKTRARFDVEGLPAASSHDRDYVWLI